MPKKQKPVVVTVPLTHAVEMWHHGYAKISTGDLYRGDGTGACDCKVK